MFQSVLRYFRYKRLAIGRHRIHSPFVFDFIEKVLRDKKEYRVYGLVEHRRKVTEQNKTVLETMDYGAGAGDAGFVTSKRTVAEIAKRTGISKKQGRLLHRIINYYNPENCLELGTSVGISTLYQASAAFNGRFTALEGCPQTAAIAGQNLSALNILDVEIITGNFDNTLPRLLGRGSKYGYVFIDGNHTYEATTRYFRQLLPHLYAKSIVIFHDIHYSEGMEKAWNEIKTDPAVTVSIDLFHMGLVFFRPESTKEDFIITFA